MYGKILKYMEYLAVLGRLEKLSLAELESQFGEVFLRAQFTGGGGLATFKVENEPKIDGFGGVLKFGRKVEGGREEVVRSLVELPEGKITLGVSDFRGGVSGGSEDDFVDGGGKMHKTTHGRVWKSANGMEALKIKKELKRAGRSVRVLENREPVLSTATSHHNQLAEKKNHVEILVTDFGWYILTGVQNITKYAKRDQARPARDAKVGMLPPKLAQILINLCGDLSEGARLLDPFCGTGVVLQEAFLKGLLPYGTDIDPRMVEYSRRNLDWIGCKEFVVEDGDARTHVWGDTPEVAAVAAEIFLGQPMSRVPGEVKLREEKQRCREILLDFLRNIGGQIQTGTPLSLAIPAWRRENGEYERLGILDEVRDLGYNVGEFRNLGQKDLLYYREGQIVAREIIVLRKK